MEQILWGRLERGTQSPSSSINAWRACSTTSAERMIFPCMLLKITGWTIGGLCAPSTMPSTGGGEPGGCLDFRISKTDVLVPSGDWIVSFSRSAEPLPSLDSSRRAAFVLPSDISLTNICLFLSSLFSGFLVVVRRFWMVEPSSSSYSMSPAFHNFMRLCKQATWSLDLEEWLGFCKVHTYSGTLKRPQC